MICLLSLSLLPRPPHLIEVIIQHQPLSSTFTRLSHPPISSSFINMASKRSDTLPMHNGSEKDKDFLDSCDNFCRCLGGAFIFLFVIYSISIIPFSSIFAFLGTLWTLFDTWVLGTIYTLTVKFWSLVYYVVRLTYLLIAWPFTAIWSICHGMPSNSGFFGNNSSAPVFSPVLEISGLLGRYSAVEAVTGDLQMSLWS